MNSLLLYSSATYFEVKDRSEASAIISVYVNVLGLFKLNVFRAKGWSTLKIVWVGVYAGTVLSIS